MRSVARITNGHRQPAPRRPVGLPGHCERAGCGGQRGVRRGVLDDGRGCRSDPLVARNRAIRNWERKACSKKKKKKKTVRWRRRGRYVLLLSIVRPPAAPCLVRNGLRKPSPDSCARFGSCGREGGPTRGPGHPDHDAQLQGPRVPPCLHRGSRGGFATPLTLQGRGNPLDEERRLFYVALTRARFTLTLTHCAGRKRYGQVMPCHPSSFLRELPPELVDSEDAAIRKPWPPAPAKASSPACATRSQSNNQRGDPGDRRLVASFPNSCHPPPGLSHNP